MVRQGRHLEIVPPASNQNTGGRIVHIELDERTVLRRSPEVEQERAIAIYDLIEDNTFSPAGHLEGAYHLHLSIEDHRLHFDIRSVDDTPLETLSLGMAPFRTIVRDYFLICESYYDAIKRLTPSQIETIDMARRSLHDEGAQQLLDRLAGRIDMDNNTARRLFTLICVLHIRG